MKIRRIKDISKIKELHSLIFPEDDFDIEKTDELWLVYNDDNKEIGFCSLRVLPDKMAYFNWAGLLENYWGKGLHRRMISVRTRWAKKNKLEYLLTYTLNNIHSSVNLIKSNFEVYEPNYEWADENCLYFRKKIR